MNTKKLFARFLGSDSNRLHFAAHSHHPWPDVSFEAQSQAWRDASRLIDEKWDRIFQQVLPEAQGHVARILDLSDPKSIAFAPNTHDLVVRIFSSLEGRSPLRVLTTDSEFHSFERQLRRWDEASAVEITRVPAEPFAGFSSRFREEAARGGHDVVYVSQVFYNSGFVVDGLTDIVGAIPGDALVLIDGYHGFMALPTDLSSIERRVFYLAGGYKYAMSGEGVCFAHCPPEYAPRPVNTGWFAGFDDLEDGVREVTYAGGGQRLMGATFDPTALYRFNAVMGLWRGLHVTVEDIHAHALALQRKFLDGLDARRSLSRDQLVPEEGFAERGNFLTFRLPGAAEVRRKLRENDVIVDARADRLRIGFGIYQDETDVEELLVRVERVFATSERIR